MDPQALPGRVAYPHLPVLAISSSRPAARVPRLWPDLSAEAQMQIAQIIAALTRRMQAIPGTPATEKGRADRLKHRDAIREDPANIYAGKIR
jgi:hypothetical protein